MFLRVLLLLSIPSLVASRLELCRMSYTPLCNTTQTGFGLGKEGPHGHRVCDGRGTVKNPALLETPCIASEFDDCMGLCFSKPECLSFSYQYNPGIVDTNACSLYSKTLLDQGYDKDHYHSDHLSFNRHCFTTSPCANPAPTQFRLQPQAGGNFASLTTSGSHDFIQFLGNATNGTIFTIDETRQLGSDQNGSTEVAYLPSRKEPTLLTFDPDASISNPDSIIACRFYWISDSSPYGLDCYGRGRRTFWTGNNSLYIDSIEYVYRTKRLYESFYTFPADS